MIGMVVELVLEDLDQVVFMVLCSFHADLAVMWSIGPVVEELDMKKDHRLVLELVVCSGGGGLEEEELSLWAFCPSKHIISGMLALCHKGNVKNIRSGFKNELILLVEAWPKPLRQ